MISAAFRFQIDRIKHNPIAFLLVVISGLGALYVGYHHQAMKQAVAYLGAMWLCSFLIDLYAIKKPARNDFIVKAPKKETAYFVLCLIVGTAFMILRFSGLLDWEHLSPVKRLAMVPLMLFVFPVVLAAILLLRGYKPRELGLRLQGFIPVIPIVLISFLTNRLVCPQSFTWNQVVAEGGGVLGALFSGLILAGLSEEFFRVIGQTRIGALLKNKGLGWYITTLIWALMHAPKWYGEGHDLTEALLGSIRIIPLGLMWGYLTHRTKSILPSVLVHGSNYWGLQNF